jgi:uncharacterized protein YndB with AHSA1/START domain
MDIEKTFELPFSPEAVYAAWVSSGTVIPPATSMDIDPVVGGHYRLVVKDDQWDTQNEGKFLEVEENKHLRYTWEWNKDGDVTEIDVTFDAAATGSRLTLVHSGFKSQENYDNHDAGWDGYIQGLTAFIGSASS